MFYVEPLTECDRPVWKISWINYVERIVISIRKNSPRSKFCCVVGDGLEAEAQEILKNCKIACINHTELIPRFGVNALSVATKWYCNEADDEQVEMGNIVLEKILPFNPDLCLTFSSANFLKKIFPNIPIIYFEHGLFSRAPFPETAYLDPFGMFSNSYLSKNAEKIKEYSFSQNEISIANIVRNKYLPYISNTNTISDLVKPRLTEFKTVILVAMQFSQFYGYDANAYYHDQYDLLIQTLSSVSSDVAVIAVEHPQYPLLKAETISYLTKKFSNFIWFKEFREIPSASQYLIELCDVVVTVSSSVGLLSLLWKKRLIVLGNSHLDLIADGHDFSQLAEILQENWPLYKENVLVWQLTRYSIPFNLLFEKGLIFKRFKLAIQCAKKNSFNKYYFAPYCDLNEISEFYMREEQIENGS